jgi:hypothetical protein
VSSEETEKLDWAQYLIDVHVLADKVGDIVSGAMAVFGSENGVIPAFLISKRVGIPYLDGPRATFHANNGGTLLYVTDYTSTGEDLIYYKRDCKIASVYFNPSEKTLIKPDAFAREVQAKMVYPWDFSRD